MGIRLITQRRAVRIACAVALLVALPWMIGDGIYRATLATLPGRPPKPGALLPRTVAAALWASAEDAPTREMQRGSLWRCLSYEQWSGASVSYSVARLYLGRNGFPAKWTTPYWRGRLRWKLSAAALMVWTSRNMTADEALTRWAEDGYFGDGVYGASNAARHYFEKPIEALSADESAVIAALAGAPSLDPVKRSKELRASRDRVLVQMARAGELSDVESFVARPVGTVPRDVVSP